MGRHSRKGPESAGSDVEAAVANAGSEREGIRPGPGSGRRRKPSDTPDGADGHTPFRQTGHVRGGHPEQHESGGGWGTGAQQTVSGRQQQAGAQPLVPGPRREFVEAFDTPPAPPAPRGPSAPPAPPAAPYSSVGERNEQSPCGEAESPTPAKGTRGRTLTGIAAAAVTTVLAVVVAGQVAHDDGGGTSAAQPAGVDRNGTDGASRSDGRPARKATQGKPLSYAEKMAKAYPISPELHGSGEFEAVPGTAKAPGSGRKYRYRIDVEKGLGLDASLFARAVQETLNDDRSWAHDGAMTFERISSGDPDFVITLASPGTTGEWCWKSGLVTTEDNVSCDSAATERVMINAYRWAQGSPTFGPDKLFAYRQMLINHEVGHRLGHDHASCRTPGALAPVMQQQTKSLDIDGIKCRPNPWVYPVD
ncbi:DUF3152 domain-containing protein [Streptomyces sp. NPDC018000]|uniref:DUF3152 domain-containing protein n=1 Tax=Streptomyces sp. NPDC018000 TaxID=3365028 RepID=UPI0037904F44